MSVRLKMILIATLALSSGACSTSGYPSRITSALIGGGGRCIGENRYRAES